MSTSAARIAANKANAQRSTGPRTAEGKAAVANNALKHGLRSERNPLDLATDATLPFERETFDRMLAIFTNEFLPTTDYETHLVDRLAQIDLRLQRALRMETTHLDLSARRVHQTMSQHLPDGARTRDSWLVTLAFLHDPAALKLISQYESRLARDFARTVTQLRQSQKLRTQETAQNFRNQTQPSSLQEPREQTQPAPAEAPCKTATASEPAPPPPTLTDRAEQTQSQPQPVVATAVASPQAAPPSTPSATRAQANLPNAAGPLPNA